jgi:dienelactone hydrolase
MQFKIDINILILTTFLILGSCCSKPDNKTISNDTIWNEIEPFFTPPSEYAANFGNYRSPLFFYDGKPVNNKKDWQIRRKEILHRWKNLMGEWPSLIKNQDPEVLVTVKRENFNQNRIRFYWTPEEQTEGYLLIPEGAGKKPAVVIVYYEPETAIGKGKANRDFAYQLTKRGFVTLSIGTTEATANKTYALYYPSLEDAHIQPLSMLAYAAANAWYLLEGMPEVDSERIGIAGHSFGGKWAMFASCLFDKYACAVWSDPGIVFDESRPNINYWEPWYLGYHSPPWRKRGIITKENPALGLYPELIESGYDLHELHALMAPRPFLVSGGAEDPPKRWIALNHTIAINEMLGYENRVAMTNRQEHAPNSKSNEQMYLFLEYFLMNR